MSFDFELEKKKKKGSKRKEKPESHHLKIVHNLMVSMVNVWFQSMEYVRILWRYFFSSFCWRRVINLMCTFKAILIPVKTHFMSEKNLNRVTQ